MDDLPVRVASFVTDRVIPAEPVLLGSGADAAQTMATLQCAARAAGLWALPCSSASAARAST
ncbi:hypothetical protein ACNAW0_00680 [Micromonospora sp. SL1-18]|uniref:hypothetical protein n=1 Tax=Micromonospora sp. SL1-18 TaxID=3399128 RepID=UPI003A4E63E5